MHVMAPSPQQQVAKVEDAKKIWVRTDCFFNFDFGIYIVRTLARESSLEVLLEI